MKINFKSITVKILAACLLTIPLFTSCKEEEPKRLVIWTSCSEFAQYIELFNSTHPDCQAVLVYKSNPALKLPPANDEVIPDIIVGPWLKSDKLNTNFKSLQYLFERQNVSSSIFYPQLLENGKNKKTTYLLPVSFNLPTIIFSDANKQYVTDNYTLSPEQIREIASTYNEKNRSGAFKKMGFTPTSNDAFLYLLTKLYGANFHQEKNSVIYDKSKLDFAITSLKDWITTENGSVQTETDFAYKYLFMPDYRQVTSDRTLFSYTTSDKLFKILHEQDLNIDYRWITDGNTIPLEDDMIMMGIYKKCQNQPSASEFITWFFRPENQDAILDKKIKLHLNTESFGIAGGFSSVKEVTEKIIPIYYPQVLSNLPPEQMLGNAPQVPARWESYKTIVIEPYIRAALAQKEDETIPSIEELEKEWLKKVFD